MKRYMLTYLFLIIPFFLHSQISRLQINNGSGSTNDYEGRVALRLVAKGATQMQLSNDGSFIGARWQRYEPETNWKLLPGDGLKTVYVKFKNASGEVSEAAADIEVDRMPPQNASIVIESSRAVTNAKDRGVTLELHAEEAVQMQISTHQDFAGALWMPYRELMKWQLTNADGPKTVYARFKDVAGNISKGVGATIILDRAPPITPKITINNNEQYTNKLEVTLTILAKGATQMFIKGGKDWQPYSEKVQHVLEPGDGEKMVRVRFKDESGNLTSEVSDNIILDTEAPQSAKMIINGGNRYTREFFVSIRLAAIGAAYMMVSNKPDFAGGKWEQYSVSVSNWNIGDVDGVKTIYAKFKDLANNESEPTSSEIVLDRTAPGKPSVEILENKMSNNKTGMVDLKIGLVDAKYMMLSNESTFFGARWEVAKTEYKGWQLGGVDKDGNKNVYIKCRDEAGNLSDAALYSIHLDRTGPLDCRVLINEGKEFTIDKTKKVTLSVFARGATQMMVGNGSAFEGAKWQPYAEKIEWILDGDDGLKSVSVKFKDGAGNEAEPVADNIIMDRKPPSDNTIVINNSEEVTTNIDRQVLLRIRAREAVKMMIANTPDFSAERWRGYSELNLLWQLSNPDGKKTIYAKFMDEAGNETTVSSDDILLDRTPPKQGTVRIPTATELVASTNVELELNAQDAAEMMISNHFDFADGKWEPYAPKKAWVLKDEDGMKIVFAKFRDKNKNISLMAYDRVGLDKTAPYEGKIKINDGARFCTNVNKYASISIVSSDATEMMIANDKDFTNAKWQRYEMFLPRWTLDGEDGEKKIFVKFKDRAGNQTPFITSTIILDRQAPVNGEIIIDEGKSCTNQLNGKVSLAIKIEGATDMMLSNADYFNTSNTWEPYTASKDWTLQGRDGEKKVYAKFRDEAGNESTLAIGKIEMDIQAPIPGAIKVNNGEVLIKASDIKLTLSASGAVEMMVSGSPRFEGASWEAYMKTKDWKLSEGSGLKKVYVKFRDGCGNECAPVVKDINVAY